MTAAEAACEDLSVPPQGTAARTGTVAVVGLGYVGLPTALALRAAGAAVTGIDISGSRLADIRRGDVDLPPEQLRSSPRRCGIRSSASPRTPGRWGARRP
ncbi:hypothetical protein ACFQ60_44435 [Streptomyces zhihengii]